MNPFQKALLTPMEEGRIDSLSKSYDGGVGKTPDSSRPINNYSAQNNQQIATGKVEQQTDALKRINEIRNLWSSSNESQQKGLLQSQRDWEQTPFHTGQGPLGAYGASSDFSPQRSMSMGGASMQWRDINSLTNKEKQQYIPPSRRRISIGVDEGRAEKVLM
jgi:hypothetical protein